MSLIEDAMLFIKVVQAGSFTRAANSLSHSKSQISRRIANLEQRLNAELLIRKARGLQLSKQGQRFYESCLTIENDFSHALEALQTAQKSISGPVKITAPMSVGSLFIGPLLAKFMAAHPNINLTLDLSDEAHNLHDGRFDIAIRAASKLNDTSLRAKRLLTYDYTIVGSPDYFAQHSLPETPNALQKHRAITCIGDPKKFHHWPLFIDNKKTIIEMQSVASVTHMWVQKEFALQGVGLIRVPTYWVKSEIENGELISVLKAYDTAESHLFALYQNSKNLPQRIRAVIDFLAHHLPVMLNA